MVLIIGVAGAIASGKSTACQILSEQGAVHCDADKLVHRMYDPGKPAFDRIIDEFGKDVVGSDGFIDRKILGTPAHCGVEIRGFADLRAKAKIRCLCHAVRLSCKTWWTVARIQRAKTPVTDILRLRHASADRKDGQGIAKRAISLPT